MDLTLARWCAQATRWLWMQAKAQCLPLSGHKPKVSSEGSWFKINLTEACRMSYRGGGTGAGRACELRPGRQRGHWCLVIFIRVPHPLSPTCQQIYFNHMHPSLPRKEAPSKLVLPIWLWKAPPRPWLQQPQLTISTFVLSCLFVAKIAAQREFDFLSLLLKSRSATFAHSESFFCPIALVADNIKLSENRRCQKSLRTQRSLLTRDTTIATTKIEEKMTESGMFKIIFKLLLKRTVLHIKWPCLHNS